MTWLTKILNRNICFLTMLFFCVLFMFINSFMLIYVNYIHTFLCIWVWVVVVSIHLRFLEFLWFIENKTILIPFAFHTQWTQLRYQGDISKSYWLENLRRGPLSISIHTKLEVHPLKSNKDKKNGKIRKRNYFLFDNAFSFLIYLIFICKFNDL